MEDIIIGDRIVLLAVGVIVTLAVFVITLWFRDRNKTEWCERFNFDANHRRIMDAEFKNAVREYNQEIAKT